MGASRLRVKVSIYGRVRKAEGMCGSNDAFQAESALTVQKTVLQRGETVWNGRAPFWWFWQYTGGYFERHDRQVTANSQPELSQIKSSVRSTQTSDTQTRRTIDPGRRCHRADLHQHDATSDLSMKNCHEIEGKCKVVGVTESRTLLVLVRC